MSLNEDILELLRDTTDIDFNLLVDLPSIEITIQALGIMRKSGVQNTLCILLFLSIDVIPLCGTQGMTSNLHNLPLMQGRTGLLVVP